MPFCESKLWCNYHKYNFRQLRVAYNDSYTVQFCIAYLDVLVLVIIKCNQILKP